MGGHHLAAYTFNQFVAPYLSETISGFRNAEPDIFHTMETAAGFVARAGYDGEEGFRTWGEQVFPSCWDNSNRDGWAPSTLSLWESPEALMAATYRGPHGKVLRYGKDWHIKADHIPEYVLWWVPKNHTPNWAEAILRFDTLMQHGASQKAFTFKALFDQNGTSAKPDISKVKALAQANAQSTPPKERSPER
jgi:hypothetical protein